MENMFKRSVLGVAVAAAAMASVAVQAAPAAANYELYGLAAVSVWGGEAEGNDGSGEGTLNVLNESRFGLRGTLDLEKGPKMFWQMEAGDVGDGTSVKSDNGSISWMGFRDSFIGFEFDAGKVRVGRMLTPAYQILDWPYSGNKLGEVFDWTGAVEGGTNYDRQNDMVRFDSAQFGAVNFSVAAGKGNVTEDGNNWYGASASVKAGPAVFHLGYELGVDRQVTKGVEDDKTTAADETVKRVGSDTELFLVGFEATFGAIGVQGAYKIAGAEYDNGAPDQDQNSYSVGVSYSMEDWKFSLGYAAQEDLETGGVKSTPKSEDIVSFNASYFIDPSAEVFFRPYQITRGGESMFGAGVGISYNF
ncbi:porin [Photobacterium lipolyticum]|uniref:Porin n=1 Tax=Photobacterium lipolyticum TaxID=266810 RepID=A0A2T3N5A2_9GAMM|nr:porin [Photobacterium lipolyticum]PSW07631.1 porin [Photobacterium lipolyticum]